MSAINSCLRWKKSRAPGWSATFADLRRRFPPIGCRASAQGNGSTGTCRGQQRVSRSNSRLPLLVHDYLGQQRTSFDHVDVLLTGLKGVDEVAVEVARVEQQCTGRQEEGEAPLLDEADRLRAFVWLAQLSCLYFRQADIQLSITSCKNTF
jgi:hypothetical protein